VVTRTFRAAEQGFDPSIRALLANARRSAAPPIAPAPTGPATCEPMLSRAVRFGSTNAVRGQA
jgi:hypothetical protein